MSLPQLDAVGRPFAILDEIIGVLFDGSLGTPSLFAHILPMALKAVSAFLSISPSRFGATFNMKLQYALLNGLMFSFASLKGSLTSSLGKDDFQNQLPLIGKQESAGKVLDSFEIC